VCSTTFRLFLAGDGTQGFPHARQALSQGNDTPASGSLSFSMVNSHLFFFPPTAYRIIRTKVQQPPNQPVPASSHSIGKNFLKKFENLMGSKYSKELLIILMDR
jgi:hypothetical protein